MSPETPSSKTKVCPTCGTRLSENAARCLVCGTEFTVKLEPKVVKNAEKSVQASRMPEITLSLPAALGILVVILIVVGVIIYFTMGIRPSESTATEATAISETPTTTPTPTLFFTETPFPTVTPQPPIEYTVKAGDSCDALAYTFNVSKQSIIIQNNLSADCFLSVDQVLKIPYPTATVPPPPTSSPPPDVMTEEACEKVLYTVQANDTLSSIAVNYGISMEAIMAFNGKTTQNVYIGEQLKIPLCMQSKPNGPTPTATLPPPYPAPNLLLPSDGAAFTLANDVVTLQWASVGTLRAGEAYQVTIVDLTSDQANRLTDYVTDTKYIIPSTFRPKDNRAHTFRWSVTPVRQAGTDDQGQPIWVSSGATSDERVFSWVGITIESTATP